MMFLITLLNRDVDKGVICGRVCKRSVQEFGEV